ncbi:MAG: DHHW family protein, partial [Bacilli bacterium]
MKVYKTLMGSAFLVVVTLFTLLIVLQPKATFSTFENRKLATFPTVTTDEVMDGTFTKEFENFVQDHFPFRDFWLGVNTRLQLALGKTYISDVHVTEDGLMLERVADVESEDVQLAVDYVTDFKKQIGVPFELIFTPNKNIHLRSFYPSFVDSDAGLQRRNSFVKSATEKGVSPIVLGELADFTDRKL